MAQGIEDLPADDVRAFFTGNVGASAWGLAIHKEARLFAISANTHHIMIFAFALGGKPGEESSSDSEEDIFDGTSDDTTQDSDWNVLNGRPAPGQRASQNLQIILRGHRTNIPNITFCNIDADTEGKYLISTDIENCNYIWDIWQQKPICTFPFTEELRSIANGPTGEDKVRDSENELGIDLAQLATSEEDGGLPVWIPLHFDLHRAEVRLSAWRILVRGNSLAMSMTLRHLLSMYQAPLNITRP